LNHNVFETRESNVTIGFECLDAQLFDEPNQHRLHEFGETHTRKTVVERLVGNGDAVLTIETPQQVGQRLDFATRKSGDGREKKTMWGHSSQSLALPSQTADLIHVFHAQSTSKCALHFDKCGSGHDGLLVGLVSQPHLGDCRCRSRSLIFCFAVAPQRKSLRSHL
jgi:hypothetical protein